MKVWFTADHHFGHGNIIGFCRRPFADSFAMDEALVSRWNEVVGHEDEVWHLGDFAYRCDPHRIACLFDRLHGRTKHLITGHHDRRHTLQLPWTSTRPYAEIMIDKIPIILFHYALRDWSRSRYGAWNLHGQGHGRLPPAGRSCDVGVDAWEYRPISFEQIVAARLNMGLRSEQPHAIRS
ncbi:calcineurin-like phosphoesterase family protein [Methylobacterium sp. OAE515]